MDREPLSLAIDRAPSMCGKRRVLLGTRVAALRTGLLGGTCTKRTRAILWLHRRQLPKRKAIAESAAPETGVYRTQRGRSDSLAGISCSRGAVFIAAVTGRPRIRGAQ
ncbi:hypothetical protein MRX96_033132 [Rhipicephalus microplus]